MIKEKKQIPEWMKDSGVVEDEIGFSIGFEDPEATVPDHAISTDEHVDLESIQRWDVTEERNGVIGMSDRRGTRGIQIEPQQPPQASIIDNIRQITQSKEEDDNANFVLLVKGSMVTSGTAEQITANVLHIIHNDKTVSDEDIVILREMDLKDFFALPRVQQLLQKIKQKDSQR